MSPLSVYWDADHDRPRTRNARHSNAQCTNILISKSPTFSLRTSILLPDLLQASVILASNIIKYSHKVVVVFFTFPKALFTQLEVSGDSIFAV